AHARTVGAVRGRRRACHFTSEKNSRIIRWPMNRAYRLEMLVRAADTGSFAKAAQSLGITASAVSRAIAELERHLHVALFYRTTRSLRLTQEGEELYRRGREILEKLAEAESAVSRNA